jgi:hypothetical protein
MGSWRRYPRRGFIGLGLPTTAMLIERLAVDKTLRRLCGWEHRGEVCSEATFSRAFAEFARSALPSRIHEALIKRTYEDRLVGHISRDATAIEAREKPVKTAPPAASTARARKIESGRPKIIRGHGAAAARPKRKRGRPRKGEVVEKKEPRRLERQGDMSLAEMLAELPRHCAVGTKRNAKGHTTSWIGYKLHLDVADGDIPISAVLTSASLHAARTRDGADNRRGAAMTGRTAAYGRAAFAWAVEGFVVPPLIWFRLPFPRFGRPPARPLRPRPESPTNPSRRPAAGRGSRKTQSSGIRVRP